MAKASLTSPIHPTALIDASAVIGKGVRIGPYSIIGPNVNIGANTRVGPHVLVERNTIIGAGSVICKGAAVGVDPQDAKFRGKETWLEIGENAVLREGCTLSRGSTGKTIIGKNFVLLCQGHVSHDCAIGNGVIISNAVNLLDHVMIEDHVIIGGLTFVNRQCRIGALSFVGGGFRVGLDVPPFIIAGDEPLQIIGVNSVALRKHGFSDGQIENITNAYKLYHANRDDLASAIEKIGSEVAQTGETDMIMKFIGESERGTI